MEIATRCLSIAAAPFQRRTCTPTSPVMNRSKLFYKNRCKFDEFFRGWMWCQTLLANHETNRGSHFSIASHGGKVVKRPRKELTWTQWFFSVRQRFAGRTKKTWKQSWPEEREWQSERCDHGIKVVEGIPSLSLEGIVLPLDSKWFSSSFSATVKSEVQLMGISNVNLTDLAWFPSPLWHKIGVVDLGSNLDPLWCRNLLQWVSLLNLLRFDFPANRARVISSFDAIVRKWVEQRKTRVGIMYV